MSVVDEAPVRSLRRVYCYLRLSGLAPEAAACALPEVTALISGATGGSSGNEEIWEVLLRWLQEAEQRFPPRLPRPAAPPPIERGHIGYPRRGAK
jgi:hypothetical protein